MSRAKPQAIKRDIGFNPLRKLLLLAKKHGGALAKTAYRVEARAAVINAAPDLLKSLKTLLDVSISDMQIRACMTDNEYQERLERATAAHRAARVAIDRAETATQTS